ncbi:MAG: DUF4129 domain-containing protein, partial [Ferruginibacter sp.]
IISSLFFYSLSATAQQKEYVYSDSSLMEKYDTIQGETRDNEEKEKAQLPTDTLATINVKNAEADSLLSLAKDEKFNYIRNLDSLLKKQQENEKDALNKTVERLGFWQRLLSGGLLKLILWALAIIFIVIIVYNIFLNNVMFRKKSRIILQEEISEQEQFFLLDYDTLIRQSYLLADYRMATRYLFLKTLRSLAEKEMIDYDASKTNSRYLQEIPTVLQPVFSTLLLSYERVWYGHSVIPQEAYQRLETRFTLFFKNI